MKRLDLSVQEKTGISQMLSADNSKSQRLGIRIATVQGLSIHDIETLFVEFGTGWLTSWGTKTSFCRVL